MFDDQVESRMIADTRRVDNRRSTDIEMSEATYTCKIWFMEILVFKTSFKHENYLIFRNGYGSPYEILKSYTHHPE